MAEEKNIMFAVLAAVLLVTAFGLMFMIKGGPGRAISAETWNLPKGGTQWWPEFPYVPPTSEDTVAPQSTTITQAGTSFTKIILESVKAFNQEAVKQNLQMYFFIGRSSDSTKVRFIITHVNGLEGPAGIIGFVNPSAQRIGSLKVVAGSTVMIADPTHPYSAVDNIDWQALALPLQNLKRTAEQAKQAVNSGQMPIKTAADLSESSVLFNVVQYPADGEVVFPDFDMSP